MRSLGIFSGKPMSLEHKSNMREILCFTTLILLVFTAVKTSGRYLSFTKMDSTLVSRNSCTGLGHKNWHHYRKFPNKGAGRKGKTLGALSLERGRFHRPVAFYRMKIGQFLAEIWSKTPRNPAGLGSKGRVLMVFACKSQLIGRNNIFMSEFPQSPACILVTSDVHFLTFYPE